ncbi:4-amino-4-deoxy-L-arabinose transferase [Longilinea arvoryzae]|uniref:4-amino-4-deoxy-L-arabinose transferase n=1 Tax=Longilinea arvoryzae TaxID=360412 RepID=A0A0S7B7B8_9CHLR|nr:hypothetical protein [Longilinea arvoryzae]GAP13063.1 4-amino-4-deoxy-L-arabinose transferase [Longilinea arvoryzae]
MLAILPLLTYGGYFLFLYNRNPEIDRRRILLRTAVVWGVYLVIGTELLSLFHWVTQVGLALFWMAGLVASAAWMTITHRLQKKPIILSRLKVRLTVQNSILLSIICVICIATAIIAWVAPPNTIDSLAYHMPKVAHWAQDQAVHFYSTGMYAQNNMPPGAEMILLQFYVLAQSDRLVNFVEWLAMLGSLIGVSVLAAQLGARKIGQFFAAVFAVTLPMGIAQASSTMTDYVVTFWVICAASETLAALTESFDWRMPALASLAAGLAVLTKQIAAAYLFPFGILFAVVLVRRVGWKRSIGWAVLAILLACSVMAGHISRTYLTYHNLISDPTHVSEHANALLTPQGILSNVTRNAALQTGTPWPKVTEEVWMFVLKVHVKLGVDMDDPRTTSIGPYRRITLNLSENNVGNPVHAVLILFCFPITLILGKKLGRNVVFYTLIVISTFIFFSAMFKWQIFGSRYHLPFFVLSAPVFGVLLGRFLPDWSLDVVGLTLLALSWTWLVHLVERPVIQKPGDTDYPSIFQQSREDLYFSPSIRNSKVIYDEMLGRIRAANCSSIGVMISGASVEYPIWVAMDAPRKDLQIEWIVSGPTRKFAKANFKPCAVICQNCPQEWQSVRDLPLVEELSSGYQLFLAKPIP